MALPADKLEGFRRQYAERYGAWPERGDMDNGTLLPRFFEALADAMDRLNDGVFGVNHEDG